MRSGLSILLLSLTALVLAACGDKPAAEPFSLVPMTGRAQTPEMVPEFERDLMNGGTFTQADFDGKITLVNFWATWCGPCVVEIPEFVALKEEWKDRPFEILGVSMDEEGFDMVRPFAEDFYMNYPQILDVQGELGEGFGGVYALPGTFVVGSDGKILSGYLGLFPIKEYMPDLEMLVAELEG